MVHCRACQKWLFLAASQWFINSFISCLANISRVLSNPGRLDTLLFWFFPHCLNSLQRSRYFRNLCEEPMCSTAWTLSFSERWIVLFIYFCTESPLRCDGRCVFFGFFCLLLCTHLLSWPTLLYFWNNWKEKEGEITDKEKKKSWEMYLEKKLQRLKRDIFLRDS